MYWGYWKPDSLHSIKEIFKLASIFDLKELRNTAGDELVKSFDNRNIVEYLLMSDQYDAKLLKKRCIDHIINNRKNIDIEYLKHQLIDLPKEKEEKKRGARLITEIFNNNVLNHKQ